MARTMTDEQQHKHDRVLEAEDKARYDSMDSVDRRDKLDRITSRPYSAQGRKNYDKMKGR